MKNIEMIVTAHLNGASIGYLEEIVAHGVHNITNDFHGDNADEYEAFANEFRDQAKIALEAKQAEIHAE